MTRLCWMPAARRGVGRRLLTAAAALAATLASATPAHAVVQEVAGTRVGLQPAEAFRYWIGDTKWSGLSKPPETNSTLPSFGNGAGNPVMHALQSYVVYWDPQDLYHGDWQGAIDGFMANAAGSNGDLASVFAVDAQYRDASNQPATTRMSFRGAYTDTDPYPAASCTNPRPLATGTLLQPAPSPDCLTDAQVRSELQTFIAQHGLPRGMGTAYYVLTPPGLAICLDGGGAGSGHCSSFAASVTEIEADEFKKAAAEAKKETYTEPAGFRSYRRSFCSYHGAIGSGDASTILYGMIPWSVGGSGDGHLPEEDQAPGFFCQDGGFKPGTEARGELEEKEREKPHTPQEEEEFAKKNAREKREQEEAEALGLEKPHDQEPNQLGQLVGPDGSYDHGLADLIIGQIASEQQNIVTDPLLNAWQDSAGNEVTDECRNTTVPSEDGGPEANPFTMAGTLANQRLDGTWYYLNTALNMAAYRLPYPGVPCLHNVHLEPAFTAPSAVNAGELVGFDGMESDITLDATLDYPDQTKTYATFSWNFGDASPVVSGYGAGAPSANAPASSPCEAPWVPPCAASVFHSYQYGGVYNVTLTVTDVAGNTATTSRLVGVAGPPAPQAGAGAGAPGAGAGGPGSASGVKGGVGAGTVPTASAVILSRSLRKVLRSGLVVRYSVSERVTGRFEVMLLRSIAKHIGLHAPKATGLAPGTGSQVVIGKAVLATTKAGRGTVKVMFNRANVAAMRALHSGATLLLRLTVRNSSAGTAAVLTSGKLAR